MGPAGRASSIRIPDQPQQGRSHNDHGARVPSSSHELVLSLLDQRLPCSHQQGHGDREGEIAGRSACGFSHHDDDVRGELGKYGIVDATEVIRGTDSDVAGGDRAGDHMARIQLYSSFK